MILDILESDERGEEGWVVGWSGCVGGESAWWPGQVLSALHQGTPGRSQLGLLLHA